MSGSRPAVRLLHTSDIHIGGGFRAPEHGDHLIDCLCPLSALEHAVAVAAPDVVLVVGDLFDNQRVSTELVETVLTRLGQLSVPCIVTNGNHDVHDDGSVYLAEVVSGSGVAFLDNPAGSSVELADMQAVFWAKSMPIHDRKFRPLQGVPSKPAEDRWWVVLGHGHYEPTEEGRSSPLSPADIASTEADYVALGHWHVRKDVSTDQVPAWYSGAPFGVAASEQFNIVDLCPDRGTVVDSMPVKLPVDGCA